MKKSLSFVLTFAMLASMTYTPALGAEKPEDIVPKADTQVVSHAISPLEYGTPKSESETFAAYRDFIQERLGEETKTDRYIIKPLPGTTADTLSRLGGTAVVSWDTFQSGKVSQNTYAVITLAEKMDPDIYESRVGAGVAFIQPDHPLELFAGDPPQNTQPSEQAWLECAEQLHQISTGEGITVAILDDEIDQTHPELAGHFINGQIFAHDTVATEEEESEALPPGFHGTHVAGIIARLAPEARLIPLQVFENGLAYTSDIVRAIQYAQDCGAQIVNCGWGGTDENPVLEEAMTNSDLLFVTAAGNCNWRLDKYPVYPACFTLDNVISVGAIDNTGNKAYFSNYGKNVDYLAPGLDVISTTPGGAYGEMRGTSVSAGFVSGLLALTLAENMDGRAEELWTLSGGMCGNAILAAPAATILADSQFSDVPSAENLTEKFTDKKTIQISSSARHTLALKEDGVVWAWGSNQWGQCGADGAEEYPVPIPGLVNVKEVAACGDTSVALLNDGTVWTWGYQLSHHGGLHHLAAPKPRIVTKVPPIAKLSSDPARTVCFLHPTGDDYSFIECSTDGYPEAWTTKFTLQEPVERVIHNMYRHKNIILTKAGIIRMYDQYFILEEEQPDLPQMVDIASTGYSCIALDVNGYPWAYGCNVCGELGALPGEDEDVPIRLYFGRMAYKNGELLSNIKAVYAGAWSLFGIQEDDTVVEISNYHFGGGYATATEAEAPPYRIKGLYNHGILGSVSAIDGSSNAMIALLPDGTVIGWCSNDLGQLGVQSAIQWRCYPIIIGTEADLEITHVEPASISDIYVNTDLSTLFYPENCVAQLEDGTEVTLPVLWNPAEAVWHEDESKEAYACIPGAWAEIPEGICNVQEKLPQCNVYFTDKRAITGFLPERMDAAQNIWLEPMAAGKDHGLGIPHTAELPETVTAQIIDGSTMELSVIWDVSAYDPAQTGKQTLTGEPELPSDGSIINPHNHTATLEITVIPKEYEVWDIREDHKTIEITVNYGTTLPQVNETLKSSGKSTIDVQVMDLESDFEVLTFCEIELKEENNECFQEDVPGNYSLIASLPDNFTPLAENIPGPITVNVTVLEKIPIVAFEPARMDAYQSVSPEHLADVPLQVIAILENEERILVDAEWDWREYAAAKDAVGEHVLVGVLKELPSYVAPPQDPDLAPTLIVNTIPVDYEVTGVLSDNLFEGDAGLTLEELTAQLTPQLTLEITSVTEGIDLTTEYTVNVALETEKNPDFDPEIADLYILAGTLLLPENITCPAGQNYEEILLQINPVEILNVEPVYALANEGIPFAQLEDLPSQVLITLSCVGLDGENKKILVGADWGRGQGYDPFPAELTDDNSVTMEITGVLADYPQYVNGAEVEATLIITMTRTFQLVAVTPSRFPAEGSLETKLGSSLDDIYTQLEDHSVELTLENARGETSTATVSFTLREEDNRSYTPTALGVQELTAYLPLGEKIQNPDGLGVTVSVDLVQYSILSLKAVRLTGVISGTPFAEIGLPETAVASLSNQSTEDVPVVWDGTGYNPTKIGSQVVRGSLREPLPIHLRNPNNRKASAAVTIVDPTAKILSLEQLPKTMLLSADGDMEELPGFTEYRYWAQVLHADGTITEEIISVFVEWE